jgi:hypothetical protein
MRAGNPENQRSSKKVLFPQPELGSDPGKEFGS